MTFHADARYLSARDGDLNAAQLAAGGKPFVRIGAQGIGDLAMTWRSANEHYSVGAYVRNVTDNRYLSDVILGTNAQPFTYTQTQYDPRTYGVILNVRF